MQSVYEKTPRTTFKKISIKSICYIQISVRILSYFTGSPCKSGKKLFLWHQEQKPRGKRGAIDRENFQKSIRSQQQKTLSLLLFTNFI